MREVESILGIAKTDLEAMEKAVSIVEHNANELAVDTFDDDYSFVRENLMELILETKTSVKRLSLIADDTEKSQFYIALSSLTKTLLDINKQLMDLHVVKKTHKESQPHHPSENTMNINNAIFVGKTTDLKKMLREDLAKEGT